MLQLLVRCERPSGAPVLCSTRTPGPEHSRALAAALLGVWELAVATVYQVIVNLPRAPSVEVVRRRLDAASRNIEQGDLLMFIGQAITRIDPYVDAERVKKKYEQDIRGKLKARCLAGRGLDDYARQLVEEAVTRESRRCPVNTDWLAAEGLTPGPELGAWLRYFQKEWEQQPPSVTAAKFEAVAREYLQQSLKKPGNA
jgi:hypothetical protein